jgi:hypothetical protein
VDRSIEFRYRLHPSAGLEPGTSRRAQKKMNQRLRRQSSAAENHSSIASLDPLRSDSGRVGQQFPVQEVENPEEVDRQAAHWMTRIGKHGVRDELGYTERDGDESENDDPAATELDGTRLEQSPAAISYSRSSPDWQIADPLVLADRILEEDVRRGLYSKELYFAVLCKICHAQVGVVDETELYHFYSVFPSEP